MSVMDDTVMDETSYDNLFETTYTSFLENLLQILVLPIEGILLNTLHRTRESLDENVCRLPDALLSSSCISSLALFSGVHSMV